MIKKSDVKPTVMISFKDGGQNGGPYNSHLRIMDSRLNKSYNFVPLIIPSDRFIFINFRIIRNIMKQIKIAQPDIIHFTGLQLEGFHTAIACKMMKIKNTIVAIHGSSNESTEFPKWKKKIVKILEILTLQLTSTSYGVSNYVGGWDLVRFSQNYFGTIYNLSHLKKDSNYTNKTLFRDEYGIDQNEILIVSTGRITEEKGYRILLNIILKMNIPADLKFIIIGDGSYLGTFKEQLILNTKNDSVLCLGYRDDVDRILQECNIFIMPSLHETLCMSVLEACFFGIPSIASNVGGLPEIIEHGYNGYLIDPNNIEESISYIELLAQDSELRLIMGENAKNLMNKKFDQESILNRINQLYSQFTF